MFSESFKMFVSKNDGTPKSNLCSLGHNDSGYDGLDSAKKMLDASDVKKLGENFDAEKIRSLLEKCSNFESSKDQFWVAAVNYLMVLVMVASMCYVMVMGDLYADSDDSQVKLGGKRAAIQFYYDSVHGREETEDRI